MPAPTPPWKPAMGPSVKLVQDTYLKIRLAELDKLTPVYRQKVIARIKGLINPAMVSRKTGQPKDPSENWWIDVYNVINEAMKKRPLTINFKGAEWFGDETKALTWTSYAQMYGVAEMTQKEAGKPMGATLPTPHGSRGGDLVLYSVASNAAKSRANVDDAVTFPASWKVPDQGLSRGLRPNAGNTRSRIHTQMAFQGSPRLGPELQKFEPSTEDRRSQMPADPHFNPKTKQVFAALNYGARRHGSIPFYGDSHFVLVDRLKEDAIYYPKDTFAYSPEKELRKGSRESFTYEQLAAAIGFNPIMANDIVQSCFNGLSLPDTQSTQHLLEAHIHHHLPFEGNIKKMVLSLAPQFRNSLNPIMTNAEKFARKWKTTLEVIDP